MFNNGNYHCGGVNYIPKCLKGVIHRDVKLLIIIPLLLRNAHKQCGQFHNELAAHDVDLN